MEKGFLSCLHEAGLAARVCYMNIDRRIRGLEGRLTELEGGEDTRVDELADKIEGIRQDVKKILDLLEKREGEIVVE